MSMPRSVLIFLGLGAASLMTLGTLSQAFAIPLADTRVIPWGCGTIIGSEGNGTAHLEANGDVTVTVNGQVRVNEDKDGVSVDNKTGDWTRSGLSGDDVQYDGNGSMTIHGDGLVADLSGAGISINGTGCGSATLTGLG